MATGNKFDQFTKNMGNGVHNFSSNALKVFMTNSAPSASNNLLANITEISYTYCSARALTISSWAQTSGVAKLIIADLTITATGGNVGPFRYYGIYDDTPTSPADPLMVWWDYGQAITLTSGQVSLLDFDGTNGVVTI